MSSQWTQFELILLIAWSVAWPKWDCPFADQHSRNYIFAIYFIHFIWKTVISRAFWSIIRRKVVCSIKTQYDIKKNKKYQKRREQDSNLRGKIPLDFESNALTTRPSRQTDKRGLLNCNILLTHIPLPYAKAYLPILTANLDKVWFTLVRIRVVNEGKAWVGYSLTGNQGELSNCFRINFSINLQIKNTKKTKKSADTPFEFCY